MFFIRPDPRKWYIPYGKVVCHQCARNKPTQLMEYTPPISCGICGIEKDEGQFLVYMIAEKPQIERKMPLMQNIMFSGDNPSKILNQTKTLTARCWKRKPPRTGQLMTASTGYKKETRFAIIRVTNVCYWDGISDGIYAEAITGLTKQQIAEREGFGNTPRPPDSSLTDWDAFIDAYDSINGLNAFDLSRQDYFISFELVQPLDKGEPNAH